MRSVGKRRAAGPIQIGGVDRDICCLVCSGAETASEPGARSTFRRDLARISAFDPLLPLPASVQRGSYQGTSCRPRRRSTAGRIDRSGLQGTKKGRCSFSIWSAIDWPFRAKAISHNPAPLQPDRSRYGQVSQATSRRSIDRAVSRELVRRALIIICLTGAVLKFSTVRRVLNSIPRNRIGETKLVVASRWLVFGSRKGRTQ
jgi:hypothetical protein